MFKNPLAISLMLLSFLVALAYAKGKTTSSEHRTPASLSHTSIVRPGSLQSAN